MAINVFPTPSTNDNWVQIATNTPSGTNTITFSSIAQSYSKLLVIIAGQTTTLTTTSANNYFLINGSTNGYAAPVTAITAAGTFANAARTTQIEFPPSLPASCNIYGYLTIDSANTTTPKRISGALINSTTTSFISYFDNGFFNATNFVSSIAFTLGGGANFSGGAVFTLYGVRA